MMRDALKRLVDNLSKTELWRLEGWLAWRNAKTKMQAFEATLNPPAFAIVSVRQWGPQRGEKRLAHYIGGHPLRRAGEVWVEDEE